MALPGRSTRSRRRPEPAQVRRSACSSLRSSFAFARAREPTARIAAVAKLLVLVSSARAGMERTEQGPTLEEPCKPSLSRMQAMECPIARRGDVRRGALQQLPFGPRRADAEQSARDPRSAMKNIHLWRKR